MGIKKIDRSKINEKLKGTVAPAPVVVEPEVEPVLEEQITEPAVEEQIEVEENEVETSKKVVTEQPIKKVSKPKTKKKENKGEKKMLKGNKKNDKKEVKAERSIGTVYPKDLLLKEIQAELKEKFEGVTLPDCKYILDVVEAKLLDACQIASVRFFGGVLSAAERSAQVVKSPAVEYSSFLGKRHVVSIRGAEIGQPVKYQGNREGNTFTVTAAFNYETNQYEPAEGTIVLNEETGEWEEQ